jgi:hypothetical protein
MKALLTKTNTFLKFIVEKIAMLIQASIYVAVGMFVIVIFFAVPFSKLADPKFDTLPITN